MYMCRGPAEFASHVRAYRSPSSARAVQEKHRGERLAELVERERGEVEMEKKGKDMDEAYGQGTRDMWETARSHMNSSSRRRDICRCTTTERGEGDV